ncbi:branched-chain amino acid aminotransferase [Candidatus Fermentibacteria bacterium]|nr:branched-chain amino acid aminotransferase [Candidatus Fermentibacteria bacterium]
MDWDNLGFKVVPTKTLYVARTDENLQWQPGACVPYGPLEIHPASGALNYGQSGFEGMKAFDAAGRSVVLFRPHDNARRMQQLAERLCMPPYPVDDFVAAVLSVVNENREFIPPGDKGSLYIRPVLSGSGPVLGVGPASSYIFYVFVSPVGPYFKGGIRPIDLLVTDYHRAAPNGTGNVKAAGNYAASLKPLTGAKSAGYDEVLYLDAREDIFVEEVGAANFFAVLKSGVIVTPRHGSILPGITRDSIIRLSMEHFSWQVEERDIEIHEVLGEAAECFSTGTAAVVTPIGSITYRGARHALSDGKPGEKTMALRDRLVGIQRKKYPDPYSWVVEVPR